MSDNPAGFTMLGIATGLILTAVPRVVDRVMGRKKDAADSSAVVAGGASAVASAALHLLAAHEADTQRAQQAEADCRRALAEVAARLTTAEKRVGALESEIVVLRSLHSELDPE